MLYKTGVILISSMFAFLLYTYYLSSKGAISAATLRYIGYAGVILMFVFMAMLILGSKGENRRITVSILVTIVVFKLIRIAMGW
jgi:uncharacterized membrane protein